MEKVETKRPGNLQPQIDRERTCAFLRVHGLDVTVTDFSVFTDLDIKEVIASFAKKWDFDYKDAVKYVEGEDNEV